MLCHSLHTAQPYTTAAIMTIDSVYCLKRNASSEIIVHCHYLRVVSRVMYSL